MQRLAAVLLVIGLSALSGCSPGLNGLWRGSGKVGLDRFFTVTLDLRDDQARFAIVRFDAKKEVRTAVCSLSEVEGRVSFKLNLGGGGCSGQSLYSFKGERGGNVIVGKVYDPSSKETGLFRAFKVQE